MAAEQLKNSILQMAISGKLVPQDPNDEPASVLLERVRKEKEQLIKEGKIKKEKNPSYIFRGADNTPYEKVGNNEPVSIADEVPFEIPESWEWVRASSLGKMIRGKGIKRTETVEHGLPCVRYGEIYTTYNFIFSETKSFISSELDNKCLHFSKGDIIFTLTGENKVDIAKAVAYTGELPVAAGGDMAFWTMHGMNPLYLVYYMASPYCIEQKRRTATGDIIVHISTDKVGSFLVPIPPVEEQKRIVCQLLLIEKHIAEYRNTDNSLKALNGSFPDQLKKSILQFAVQGRLVEQRPEEGTSEEWYKQVKKERERLIEEGAIKKSKPFAEISDDEIPFDIPDSWKWFRIGEVFNLINGFTPLRTNPEFWSEKDIPWFTIDDVHRQGRFITTTEKFISQKALSKKSNRIVPPDSVLLCCTASVGEYAYTKIALTTNQQFNAFVTKPEFKSAVYPMYVYEYAKTLKGALIKNAGKTTFNFLSVGKLSSLLIPIPPLAEQKRIVAKLEEVLSLCDRII